MKEKKLMKIRKRLEKKAKLSIEEDNWNYVKKALEGFTVGKYSVHKGDIIRQLCNKISSKRNDFKVIQNGENAIDIFEQRKEAIFMFCREDTLIWDIYLYVPSK